MAIAVIAVLALFFIYILLLKCRSQHSGMKEFRNFSYAHRGLHSADAPENSMLAFRRALNHGYGIELDVHLLADGNLAVIHDYNLQRVTGEDVVIESLTAEQLQKYHLNGTEETIPLLSQVLQLFQGKTPLIVELKSANNADVLAEATCKLLDKYDVKYCIESFDPQCIRWLKKNRPDVIRGQLSENFLKDKDSKFPWFVRFLMTFLLTNFLTQPDFVAYRFRDRRNISFLICRLVWRAQGVVWTVQNEQENQCAREENLISIFENFKP